MLLLLLGFIIYRGSSAIRSGRRSSYIRSVVRTFIGGMGICRSGMRTLDWSSSRSIIIIITH